MASFEQLDLLLGEALEKMMDAAREIRLLKSTKEMTYIRHIGTATTELWAIREDVYSIHPEIKRDFFSENEKDPQRFEMLDELNRRANAAEEKGEKDLAKSLYVEMLNSSEYGWFKLLAEAGLYRTLKNIKKGPTSHFSGGE